MDVDSDKNLIGIEFLDASKVLKVDSELLIHPNKIFAEIITDNREIKLIMRFEFENITREIDVPIYDILTSNNALIVND